MANQSIKIALTPKYPTRTERVSPSRTMPPTSRRMGCFWGGAALLDRLPPFPDAPFADVDFFCVVDATATIPPWEIM